MNLILYDVYYVPKTLKFSNLQYNYLSCIHYKSGFHSKSKMGDTKHFLTGILTTELTTKTTKLKVKLDV